MKSSIHKFRITPSPAVRLDNAVAELNTSPNDTRNRKRDERVRGIGSELPVLACERCRRMKKKCSKTLPECIACVHAGSQCSFSEQPPENWTREELEGRLRLLLTYINDRIPPATPSPRSPLEGESCVSPRAGVIANDGDREKGYINVNPHTIEGLEQAGLSLPQLHFSSRGESITHQAARNFVDAYFRHVHRAYPFINQKHVLSELERLADPVQGASNTLYLIMAIGCTTLERAGELQQNSSSSIFSINSQALLQENLGGNGEEEPIATLVLLGIWALFDPAASVWTIVGALGRQALFLGLSRKSDGNEVSPWKTELMRRLFWSIFVLDRLVSFSLGLQIGMVDHNMNVSLVGLTVDEFATSDRERLVSDLQTSRQVISLRQIEEELLEKIHLASHTKISSYSLADKTVIADGFRSQIENWYSQGCLTSPLATGSIDTSNVPFHSSVSWLSARYYNLLFMLYYPSHFNQDDILLPRSELQRFVYQYIHASAMLLSQRQLPLNWITLYRMVPVCLLLLYCFDETSSQTTSTEVSMCAEIMEAFPSKWVIAQALATTFRQFSAFISNLKAQPSKDMNLSWLQRIKVDAVEVAKRVLGRASAYNYITKALLKSKRSATGSPVLNRRSEPDSGGGWK